MKILVTGREGQLARGLVEASETRGVELVSVGRPVLDLADEKSVSALISRERPDVVVNAAAYTAVDRAESEPHLASEINALGAEYVAKACAANSIPIIHISTDFVFDGTRDGYYREDDPTGPINAYGRSKLEGEARVARAYKRHLILRTAWVHSPWGGNFVKTMLRLAAERPAISVVDDQKGSPTYAPHLAEAVLAIASRAVADPHGTPWGIYHAVGAGETTWCGFAREIFSSAAEHGLPTAQVAAITTAGFPTSARRPANSRLNCDRLRQAFGVELPDWRVGVERCIARLSESAGNPRS
ncbi:dTDP-4-dehydrorhamnose reductase [Bradyrhizobium sp.]|uniref:dTDP-4-dehydrorhamnose reductase n=1 Tax=Bradyrhizobium sp. TaxID=376 RepID=UPI002732F575|nr:dTDP-4-dehydrorhamnose reductase [Bradyrhizobium sp.]MDP3075380.1 dTDP-4-dehydrorhamnose reductase [Bradyrhizobium sp.]